MKFQYSAILFTIVIHFFVIMPWKGFSFCSQCFVRENLKSFQIKFCLLDLNVKGNTNLPIPVPITNYWPRWQKIVENEHLKNAIIMIAQFRAVPYREYREPIYVSKQKRSMFGSRSPTGNI